MIDKKILMQLIFWGVWLVIPLLWEIVGSAGAAVLILLRRIKRKSHQSEPAMPFYPDVSIIIPVYNSKGTLKACLESIFGQTYPADRLEVLLMDNGSTDNSREVFERFQSEHRGLKLWWNTSEQGKSRALNMGVFSGTGRYIVNIDSDGVLDRHAIMNIVRKFESDSDIAAMTGVVLTDHRMIGKEGLTGRSSLYNSTINLVRRCELFEYCESFLVGRSFESEFDHLHTMAGAFSCFRRELLLKTQLYNTETIGEDAHMTNQIRNFTDGRVVICDDAFYFTQPIENLNKLYVQRQRWQRAELEVAGLFLKSHSGGFISFFRKPDMRRLVSTHTLAFPRLIWMFAMIYLYFMNYPLKLLAGANILLYGAYVLLSFANVAVACIFLGNQGRVRKYIFRHFYICFVLPLYRLMLYWIRIAGIINSLTTPSKWKTKTFSEEITEIRSGANREILSRLRLFYKLKDMINGGTGGQ